MIYPKLQEFTSICLHTHHPIWVFCHKDQQISAQLWQLWSNLQRMPILTNPSSVGLHMLSLVVQHSYGKKIGQCNHTHIALSLFHPCVMRHDRNLLAYKFPKMILYFKNATVRSRTWIVASVPNMKVDIWSDCLMFSQLWSEEVRITEISQSRNLD